MLSAICFNLDQSKILSSGNGLGFSLTKILSSGMNLSTNLAPNCSHYGQ